MEHILERLSSSVSFLALTILIPIILTVVFYDPNNCELEGVPYIGLEHRGFRKKQKAWMADGRGMMRLGYLKVSDIGLMWCGLED
jgi:hypothetical protein